APDPQRLPLREQGRLGELAKDLRPFNKIDNRTYTLNLTDPLGQSFVVSVVVVVVVVGGPERPAAVVVPSGATVIAANGGVALAAELGLGVDLVVGDLDSLSAAGLAAVPRVERHPEGKDASDLELALQAALGLGPERIVVVGGGGGRLDHLFGNLLLFAAEAYSGVLVDAQVGGAAVPLVRDGGLLAGMRARVIGLVA